MDWLYSLLDNSSVPVVTALILGILTAVSPCPLATNLTAVAYIGREIDNRRKVFYFGLLYTLGRAVAYSALGAVLIFLIRKGEDAFGIQDAISTIGEWILGPALVLIGLFMLFGHLLHLPKFGFSGQASGSWTHGVLGAFILGVLFAMAFCPTSGMLYFGMLIPMSAVESGGYALPVVYAIATSLTVLVAAWIIAYSMQSLGRVMGKIAIFQRWFNRLVAILFILVGLYYTITIILSNKTYDTAIRRLAYI